MLPKCEPLCHFSDRLYFTTFHDAPDADTLNALAAIPGNDPPLRSTIPTRPDASATADTRGTYYYFSIDQQLCYLSFFLDWGPLNIAMVYKACILIHELLDDSALASHNLVLFADNEPRKKANAALLLALYVMIVQRRAPWEAFHPIAELEFMPFRDAGRGPSDFNLSIQDCLWGLWKAMQNGLCDMNDFSVDEYEFYEKVENGDWNWITPNFIAFASPVDGTWVKRERDAKLSSGTSSPSSSSLALQRRLPQPFLSCLDYFEKRNVRLVVRLNTALYDRQVFAERGIDHMELYFDDGTNPSDEIVRTFLDVADPIIEGGGVIAVHCKAGLGRTGTLIGAYLIWKYGFTASEAIAFMRIVRPGSVVGPQQQFMYLKQLEWAKWAAVDELLRAGGTSKLGVPGEKTVAVEGVKEKEEFNVTLVTPATPPAEPVSTSKPELSQADVATDIDVDMDTQARDDAPAETHVTPPRPASRAASGTVHLADERADGMPNSTLGTTTIDAVSSPPSPPATAALTHAAAHPLPPVTPSRHIAAATQRADAIPPPGQPRKTPVAKRVAVDSSDDEREKEADMAEDSIGDEDEDESTDMLPVLTFAATRTRGNSNIHSRTHSHGSGHAQRPMGRVMQGTASEQRPTRVLRSAAAGGALKREAPVNMGTRAGAGAGTSSRTYPPNKIPRLAMGSTARGTAAAAEKAAESGRGTTTAITAGTRAAITPLPSRTRRMPNPTPSTPSRLPTLVPTKRTHAAANSLSEVAAGVGATRGAGKKGTASTAEDPSAADAWMTNGKAAVVVPATKSARPGLRPIRRRRSSFSAADVVA